MTTPLERDTRRATVRQLADDGMSQRRIARRLGVSKDTVRRDLADLAQPDAPDDETPTPTATSACATSAPDDEPSLPTVGAIPAPDDEPPAPAGAPLPDEWLAIGLDDDLRDHLAVLLSTGRTLSAAIREAIEHYANAHRDAWDYENYPRGIAPRVRIAYDPYDATVTGR